MSGGILNLPRYRKLDNGWTVRLLSAWEALEVRREGEELAREEQDKALCSNACLLAHVLLRDGKPAFTDGRAVLEALTAGQIADLACRWSAFDKECDPAPWEERTVDEAKKGWSTRLMNAFNGACFERLVHFLQRRE